MPWRCLLILYERSFQSRWSWSSWLFYRRVSTDGPWQARRSGLDPIWDVGTGHDSESFDMSQIKDTDLVRYGPSVCITHFNSCYIRMVSFLYNINYGYMLVSFSWLSTSETELSSVSAICFISSISSISFMDGRDSRFVTTVWPDVPNASEWVSSFPATSAVPEP